MHSSRHLNAAWTGLSGLALELAFVAVAGGLLAVALGQVRRRCGNHRDVNSADWQILDADAPLPYAVAIAAGAMIWGLQAGLLR
jgi:Flp pilus assembly protein protease CpaA